MNRDLEVRYENKSCYNIIIRFNWDDLTENLIKISHGKARKICIVTDSNVESLYLETVREIIGEKFNEVITFTLPAGEKNKTLHQIEKLYETLILKKFYREDLLIALGGGVVGDMTGFAAATYLRGIDFVQIPTTLLSQVDSSIGGKTGVDFSMYKNMVGAFHMPKLVYINSSVLSTLPLEEFKSGMGEVVKHGIIRDREYFDFLYENADAIKALEPDAVSRMIYGSCKIKRDVVEEDPKEAGIRALLNFGHTIGHAVEKCANFKYTHGSCVAVGMLAAARISLEKGLCSPSDVELINSIIKKYELMEFCKLSDENEILLTTKSDKKMKSDGIKFVLIEAVGRAVIKTDVTEGEILSGIRSICRG